MYVLELFTAGVWHFVCDLERVVSFGGFELHATEGWVRIPAEEEKIALAPE